MSPWCYGDTRVALNGFNDWRAIGFLLNPVAPFKMHSAKVNLAAVNALGQATMASE